MSAGAVASASPAVANWRRNQAAVTGATFIGFTGFTLVMPFLPLYFGQLGVSDPARVAVWSGVSLGVTPAVTAAMAPIWARLANRLGRKLMVVRSLISFVIIMSLLALVSHPWQVLALRAIQGLFAGYGPIALTMAAESAPPDQIATAIGFVQTAQRLGPALGPVIGGSLAQAVGIRYSFLASAGVYFLAFLLVFFGYREPRERRVVPHDNDQGRITFATLAASPHFVLLMFSVFGLQIVDRSLGPILPLYLGEVGIEVARVPLLAGILFTTVAAAAAVGNQVSPPLLRRRSAAELIPMMSAVGAGAALVLGLSAPWPVLVAIGGVFGFALGVATTCTYAAATHGLPVATRGVAFAYLTSAYLVGMAVSPVLAGLIGAQSMRAVFLVDAAGLAALAWAIRGGMRRASR
ncbi:MAG TPA: MFS transporter [Vicinamibacterales bacterium]|nr:MFS transporter [Vicinamibacterales bacterium]